MRDVDRNDIIRLMRRLGAGEEETNLLLAECEGRPLHTADILTMLEDDINEED